MTLECILPEIVCCHLLSISSFSSDSILIFLTTSHHDPIHLFDYLYRYHISINKPIYLFIYKCVVYAHLLCAHVGAHTHAPAYRSQKRNQVLTLSLSTLFSWDKFLTEPRDKSHQALAIILFLPPPIWCYRNDHGYDWLQYVDTGDLNLGYN